MRKRKGEWRKNEYIARDREGHIHIFPLGLFIKDIFLRYGEVYPNQAWTKLRELRNQFTLTGGPRSSPVRGWGSYQNIKNYFYWLERLGLIERSRRVEVSQTKAHRKERGSGLRPGGRPIYYQHYRLTEKGRREEDVWRNPRRALYGR